MSSRNSLRRPASRLLKIGKGFHVPTLPSAQAVCSQRHTEGHRPRRQIALFAGAPGPAVTLRLHDRALPLKIFLKPELAVGEAYVDGTLTFEGCTVYDFLHLFAVNRRGLGTYPLQTVFRWFSRQLRSFQQYNPLANARRNVAHHYDLSRQLYELFLDQDLQYTCAYYENPDDTLSAPRRTRNATSRPSCAWRLDNRCWRWGLVGAVSPSTSRTQLASM